MNNLIFKEDFIFSLKCKVVFVNEKLQQKNIENGIELTKDGIITDLIWVVRDDGFNVLRLKENPNVKPDYEDEMISEYLNNLKES